MTSLDLGLIGGQMVERNVLGAVLGIVEDRVSVTERTAPGILTGQPFEVDLVNDGWTSIFREVMAVPKSDKPLSPKEIAQTIELADFHKMNQIRKRVSDTVKRHSSRTPAMRTLGMINLSRPRFDRPQRL